MKFGNSSKFGTQWQSRDQIWKFLKFKMADGRHIGKCWKCYNSPTSRPIWTRRGWSHAIISLTCPPWCGCHSNGRCLATAHWTFISYGRLEAERVNQSNFDETLYTTTNLESNVSHLTKYDIFLKFKMAFWTPALRLIWVVIGQVASQAPTRLPQNRGRCLLTAQWTFWFYGV